MNTPEIRTLLHEEIDQSDEKLLKMIYALVKEYNDSESVSDRRKHLIEKEYNDSESVSDRRKHLIEEERAKYLRGDGRSYSWEEVKKMATGKDRPDEI
ncbi:MAG: hypothetical protein JNM41_16415 [Flavipsychrobacter sp.]|nr:hypothetical protein [Flavipsychrobacter sp.]